jgi:hypothetical protein|tara:strand:+ start:1066 stop:1488 length:423 start_codon:yes stop_codon:yes gene_type:complete
MGTRSRIGIQLADESILSVYHHWDGYPEWLGRILKTHYNSKSKASELIDGGDMSVCWTDDHFRNSDGKIEKKAEYGPQYYSERGENCPPSLMSMNEYVNKNNNEEFAYIFRDGAWVCYNMNEFDDKDPEIVEIPNGALVC